MLLCCDLDRTVLPNGRQPESADARTLFAVVAARPDVTLAYVTGRHLALTEQAIRDYRLPQPDYIVGDVGSRIYRRHGSAWEADLDWEADIDLDWRGLGYRRLHALLADIEDLRLQAPDRQHRHKLSYRVAPHIDVATLLKRVRERLDARDLRAALVWSVDETEGIGLLDVLPARATKLHAVEFLRDELGLATADCLFAGDSGNDLPVLASNLPAVLVANASDDVRRAAVEAARAQGFEQQLYLARGGVLGMNGNYCAGILEGLLHFHPKYRAGLMSRSAAHVDG